MLVEFKDKGGNRLVINPKDVSTIFECDTTAEVYMSGNHQPIQLDATFDDVVEKLSAAS